MKSKKEIYISIGLAVVLIVVIFGIALNSILPKSSTDKPVVISPTPISINPIEAPVVNPGIPPVSYSSAATDKLINKIQNRQPLSTSDLSAKQKILSSLSEGSGYVHESSFVRIEYLKSPDVFLAEILTTNISSAKNDGVSWFQSQGMSKVGVCNLPVSFYINTDVSEQLRNSKIIFNPLAEGC